MHLPGIKSILLTPCLPGMMTFLHHDEGDAGLVVGLQLDTRLSDGRQLVLHSTVARGVQTLGIVCSIVCTDTGWTAILATPKKTESQTWG